MADEQDNLPEQLGGYSAPIRFRFATAEDGPEIDRLLALGYPEEFRSHFLLPYSLKATQKSAVIVAEYGSIVGVVYLVPGATPGSAMITNGVVDPTYRGYGFFAQLVRAAVQHAVNCRCRWVYTVFDESNTKAAEIFERLGFVNSFTEIHDEWCRPQVEYYLLLDSSLELDFSFSRTLAQLRRKIGTPAYQAQLGRWIETIQRRISLSRSTREPPALNRFKALWSELGPLANAMNSTEERLDMKVVLPPTAEEQEKFVVERGGYRVRFARPVDVPRINEIIQICFKDTYDADLLRPFNFDAYRYAASFVAESSQGIDGVEFFVPAGAPGSVLHLCGSVHPDRRGMAYLAISAVAKQYCLDRKLLWNCGYVLVDNLRMQQVFPRMGFKKHDTVVQDDLCRLSNPYHRIYDEGVLREFAFTESLSTLRQLLGDEQYRELISTWNENLST